MFMICHAQIELNVIGFFSFESEDLQSGTEIEPGFRLAIEEINASDDILSGYVLKPILANSGCSASVVVDSFINIVTNDSISDIVGIIGPECSTAAESLAQVAIGWKLPIISYSATSPLLSDTERYPTFMRLVPSDIYQARAWISLCLAYNWTDVAVLGGSATLHQLFIEEFLEQAELHNITIVTSLRLNAASTNIPRQVEMLYESGASIFFVSVYQSDLQSIAIEADKFGLLEKGYSWIGTDASVTRNLIGSGEDEELYSELFTGWLGTFPSSGESARRDAFIETILANGYPSTRVFNYAEYAYDCVYALAYGIDRLIAAGVPPEDNLEYLSTLVTELKNNTDFEGVTAGRIRFEETGDRLVPYNVNNWNGTNLNVIGKWDVLEEYTSLLNPVWPGPFQTAEKGQRPPSIIYIGGLFPQSGGWPVGGRVQPAFFMAIEDINADDTILQHYVIKPLSRNTECDPSTGLKKFFDLQSRTGGQLIGIVGAGCSTVSQAVAQVAQLDNTPMISWGSTSPSLTPKASFPTFLRTVSPDTIQGTAAYSFVKEMGWENIAVLNSNEDLHALLVQEFLNLVEDDETNSLNVLSRETFQGSSGVSFESQLSSIKAQGARVILLAAYVEDVRNIFRLASDREFNMIEGYTWIGTDAWLFSNMWIDDDGEADDIVRNAVNGAIGFGPAPGVSERAAAFRQDFMERTGDSEVYVYAETTYDAVYCFAYQLQQMLEVEKMDRYTDSIFRAQLLERLQVNTNFSLVSRGRVYFDENGDRKIPYEVLNFQNDILVNVAIWDPDTGYVVNEATNIIFSDGIAYGEYEDGRLVPRDSPEVIHFSIPLPFMVIFSVLTGIAILLALAFMIFIVLNWGNDIIIAARPLFCILISVGVIIGISSIITQMLPKSQFMCYLTPLLAHLAFIITMSLIFSKAWRVYKIFGTDTFEPVRITDMELLIWVLSAAGFFIVFFIVWSFIDPLTLTDFENPSDRFLIHTVCQSSSFYFELILYVLEAISLLFGVFLAFKTRKVAWLEYNESSYIALIVYNLTFFGAVLLPLSYLLTDDQETAKFVISSSGMLLMSVVIIGLLFFQKVSFISKQRKGKLGSNTAGTGTSAK